MISEVDERYDEGSGEGSGEGRSVGFKTMAQHLRQSAEIIRQWQNVRPRPDEEMGLCKKCHF